MRGGTVQRLFPFDHMSCALQDRLQIAFLAVLFIGFLGRSIDTDDQPVEAAFNGFLGAFVIQKVAVGGGNGVKTLLSCISDHLQKIGIDKGLALEVEDQVDQIPAQFVYGFPEEIGFEVAGFPGKCTKTTRAFRAAEIAGSGGLQGDGHGQPPLNGVSCPSGQVVRCQYLSGIPQTAEGQFGKKIAGIPVVQGQSGWWLDCQSKGLLSIFALLPKNRKT